MKKAKAKPLRGNALLRAVINQIIDHPETWDQTRCYLCLAGHAQVMGGMKANCSKVTIDAEKLLGLTHVEANYLFSRNRTLTELYGFAFARLNKGKLPRL